MSEIPNLSTFTNLERLNIVFDILNLGRNNSCVLGPFQLIPHNPKDSGAKFTDLQDSTKSLITCRLWRASVKYPDNFTETELQWINKSYVDLTVLKNILHFKVRRCVHVLSHL